MEVFEAIGDPVRREILVALAREGSLSAGEIAGRFAISRPAVSRHLRVLRESGVVHDEVSGRRRIYRLAVDGLEPLRAWLSELTPQPADDVWSARFDALDTEVRRTRRDRSRGAPRGGSAETTTPPETTRETA
ncbi:MAG TPA: metalloregulator ArsR/SmtB family transcription factor [Microlunatus sp.]|jgi:DNA-binding transcriptional ArsR family regulator|nr:metalloregulator ArsR/SmtB family transcription factor [Microlunatus sp.]